MVVSHKRDLMYIGLISFQAQFRDIYRYSPIKLIWQINIRQMQPTKTSQTKLCKLVEAGIRRSSIVNRQCATNLPHECQTGANGIKKNARYSSFIHKRDGILLKNVSKHDRWTGRV